MEFLIRIVIKQVFAQMEAKIILTRFLRAFDYECVNDDKSDEIAEGIIHYIRHGLRVKLKQKTPY